MQLQQAEQEQPLRARTATLAVPASAEQAPALGRALALALEADKRAFQRAVTLLSSSRSDASEDALVVALSALQAHVATRGDAPAASLTSHDPLLSPLLDAVVRSKLPAAHARAWRLLDWLVAQPHGGRAVLTHVLATNEHAERRARLGAALAVRHLYEAVPVAASTPSPRAPLPPGVESLPAACRALLATVRDDGTERDGAPAPTRLTAAAADALLCATAAVCAAVGGADDARACSLLWQLAPSMEAVALAMAAWGTSPRAAVPVRSLALREAARHVANVRAHGEQPDATQLHPTPPSAALVLPDSDDEEGGEASSTASPRAVACQALGACWLHYAPLMLCEPADGTAAWLASNAERWLSTLASACAAKAQGEVSERRAEAAQLHALTCIGLLVGAAEAHPEGGASSALEAPGWAAAPRALVEALRSPHNKHITELAVACLRIVLLPPGGGGGATPLPAAAAWLPRSQAALDALLPMLEEEDGVSRAGVALLGELVTQQPGLAALRHMLDKLASPSAVARRNTLSALCEALARGAGQAPHEHGGADPHALLPEYAATLAERILPCLSDADLASRHAAAALFGRVSPSCVLPPLLQLCSHRDSRTRSAATVALVAVLQHHTPPARALTALLACIASPAAEDAATSARPARALTVDDAGAEAAVGASRHDVAVERAIDALRKWAAAEVVPTDVPFLTDALLSAVTAAPSDAALVRAAAALGTLMGAPGGPAAHTLRRLRELLVKQPASDAAPRLFERLSPLLLLRVLPLAAFDDPLTVQPLYEDLGNSEAGDTVAGRSIAAELLRRMVDTAEADDVRRVSSELVGRLRPAVAWPRLEKRIMCYAERQQLRELRACLFAACAAIAARGVAALPSSTPPSRALLASVTRLLTLTSNTHGDEHELVKTHLGCMDFLAALVAAQLQTVRDGITSGVDAAPCSRIVEIGSSDRADGCAAVLSCLLAVVTCSADTVPWCDDPLDAAALPSVRACFANALIAAGRLATVHSRAALAREILPVAARALARTTMPAYARTACFQVLFATTHHAGVEAAPFASDLAELAAAALRAAGREDAATRLAAAKLLTALLAADDAVLTALAGSWRAIGDAVRGVSALDADAELRGVCETLSRALGAHG